jgi:hypothetical protein
VGNFVSVPHHFVDTKKVAPTPGGQAIDPKNPKKGA